MEVRVRPRTVVVVLLAVLAGAVALLLARRGESPAPRKAQVPRPGERTEFLLAMEGGDEVTDRYVTRVLAGHGIWSNTVGSIGWGTSVRAVDRADAERWIRKEDGLRGYVTWLPDHVREEVPPPEPTTVTIGEGYAAALRSHPSGTLIGRVLRSEDLLRELQGSTTAKVESVRWIVRPLVTEALQPTTATVATVALQGVTAEYPYPMNCTVVLEGG